MIILLSAQTKNPVPKISNRVHWHFSNIFFIRWDASNLKSTHLIDPFLDVLGRFGGDLDLKAKNLTQW